MILRPTKTEYTDQKTGMVLKRITTSEWETHNHKIAVNNSMFSCEKARVENRKPILNAHFQVYHIFFNSSIELQPTLILPYLTKIYLLTILNLTIS